MRIGIDARFYGPKVGGGGIGRYVSELVSKLQEIDHQNEYVIFLKKANFHECVIKNSKFEKRMVDVHWYTLAEQTVMPREIWRAKVDFMHYPHWNIPLMSRVPFLVTIHDLILLEDPTSARSTTHSAAMHGLKRVGHRLVLEKAIHRSQHIITPSNYAKSSILKHFGIKPGKISVIPNGVQPPRAPQNVNLSALGVYEPYFLYVGNSYPHKNLEMMLHSFARFRQTHQDVQLVLAGSRDQFSRMVETEARDLNLPAGCTRFIDLPTDDEIAQLYRHAALFIWPSRIEGFGIPPLEAMSYGTPVAASSAPAMPEILQDAANYFDPDDVEALEELMRRAVEEPQTLEAKREAGIAMSQNYNWAHTARHVLELYQRFHNL